jgi:hypothetical protein
LTEKWHQPSAATTAPVVAGSTVVTGDGSTVVGRDPLSGSQQWLYRRDLPLCTVGSGWEMALAVYRRGQYCGEITALLANSGTRGPQRSSDIPWGTSLLSDGNLVTATGSSYVETWRSDLVKTLGYGKPRATIEPGSQPRPDCTHTSVAVTTGRVGVLEGCPEDSGDRLTVLRPDSANSDHPDQIFSVVLPTRGARIVAMSPTRAAVLLPSPTRLSIRDGHGNEVASYPMPALTEPAAAPSIPTIETPEAILWWTGSSTVALDADDLNPIWTLPGSLGPGTLFAGQPVIPAPNAELVVNPATGVVVRTITVNRNNYQGPVVTSTCGPVLLEQRGSMIVALS